MSDLISRSELILHLSDYALQESPNDNERTGEQRLSKMIYDVIQNCITYVGGQPTAYDVDKVVEELEIKKQNALEVEESIKEYNVWKDAIEIVKQGVVSDDVCEWKPDYGLISDKYKRETSCGYTFYDLHHAVPFKFCPY